MFFWFLFFLASCSSGVPSGGSGLLWVCCCVVFCCATCSVIKQGVFHSLLFLVPQACFLVAPVVCRGYFSYVFFLCIFRVGCLLFILGPTSSGFSSGGRGRLQGLVLVCFLLLCVGRRSSFCSGCIMLLVFVYLVSSRSVPVGNKC